MGHCIVTGAICQPLIRFADAEADGVRGFALCGDGAGGPCMDFDGYGLFVVLVELWREPTSGMSKFRDV